MAYITGVVTAVPAANKDAYRRHASLAAEVFKKHGALRVVEAWGVEVPKGKVNDFMTAVQAKPDEVVVFSWIEFPSKEACDEAFANAMKDPALAEAGEMPFDGQRMIYGGFEVLFDL